MLIRVGIIAFLTKINCNLRPNYNKQKDKVIALRAWF